MSKLDLTLSDNALISVRVRNDKELFNKLQNVLPKDGRVFKNPNLETITWYDVNTYESAILHEFNLPEKLIYELNDLTHQGLYIFNHVPLTGVNVVDTLSGNGLLLTHENTNILSTENKFNNNELLLLIAIQDRDGLLDRHIENILNRVSRRQHSCVLWGDYTFILVKISLKDDSKKVNPHEFELVLTPIDEAFATVDIINNRKLADCLYACIDINCEPIETANMFVTNYEPGSEYDVLFALDVPTDFSQLVDQSPHKGVYVFNLDTSRPVVFSLPEIGYTKDISGNIARTPAFSDGLVLAVIYDDKTASNSAIIHLLKTLTEHLYRVIRDKGYTIILVATNADTSLTFKALL